MKRKIANIGISIAYSAIVIASLINIWLKKNENVTGQSQQIAEAEEETVSIGLLVPEIEIPEFNAELEPIDNVYLMLSYHDEETETEVNESETEEQSTEITTEIALPESIEILEVEEILNQDTTGRCDLTGKKYSIHDAFSEYELTVFAQVVKSEIGGGSFEAKCNVVSVIFNRLALGGNILDVLFAPEQFAVVTSGIYAKMDVTQDIIDAIEYVYENGDTTNGCRYFNTINKNSWAAQNREFVLCDGYHNYYR